MWEAPSVWAHWATWPMAHGVLVVLLLLGTFPGLVDLQGPAVGPVLQLLLINVSELVDDLVEVLIVDLESVFDLVGVVIDGLDGLVHLLDVSMTGS